MAFSVPKIYLEQLVTPMLERFKSDPSAYDLAFSACTLISHFADVFAKKNSMSAAQARKHIATQIPDFLVVDALSNSAKHVEVDHRHGVYKGTRAEHAKVGKGAAFSDGSYYSDGSSHSDALNTVTITLPNNRKIDVLHVCESVASGLGKLY